MEKIRRQFDVNVLGLLDTTKAVLPHFRANGRGTIVNISSIGGKVTFPLGALYHGTKFAVEGLSEALYYELAAIGVQVKIVEPGFVNTDFAGRSFDFTNDEDLAEYQKLVEAFQAAQAQQDTGDEPEVVAEVVYQAATDGTDRLRYPAGPYAAQLIATRAAVDDATFIGGVKQQFGALTPRRRNDSTPADRAPRRQATMVGGPRRQRRHAEPAGPTHPPRPPAPGRDRARQQRSRHCSRTTYRLSPRRARRVDPIRASRAQGSIRPRARRKVIVVASALLGVDPATASPLATPS